MAQFVLFYLTGPGKRPPERSQEEFQAVINQYIAWGDTLRATGQMVGGARLTSVWKDPGRMCAGVGAEYLATDGPLAETKEVVGGYNVVEATDYDAVVELCRNHPHLREGRVVIRQVA